MVPPQLSSVIWFTKKTLSLPSCKGSETQLGQYCCLQLSQGPTSPGMPGPGTWLVVKAGTVMPMGEVSLSAARR